nr:hypothetical protein [Providencia rettgeri]
MFDYNSNGNVKMDNNRKKYVIDADFVAQATELKKYPSLETLMIREIYTNIYIEKPLEANKIKPLYYSEIENLLPKLEKKWNSILTNDTISQHRVIFLTGKMTL